MFTEPQIYSPKELSKRAFVHFYYEGKRFRLYNGRSLEISCFPNNCHTAEDRSRELRRLSREVHSSLKKGWNPSQANSVARTTAKAALNNFLKTLGNSMESQTYKRDLKKVVAQFILFLRQKKLQSILLNDIRPDHVELFLLQFRSSGTYYMNKRRTLSAVFSKIKKQGHVKSNPVTETSKSKSKPILHEAFTEEQLLQIFFFLKARYPKLYLCSILMYGTLLRPHQEIRLLKRSHFNEDLSFYLLDGYENKGGRIRGLPVPEYVKEVLQMYNIDCLQDSDNIFTSCTWAYNESYFNTMWTRAKKVMLTAGLIKSNQTLYSFRHSASIDIFTRTQNLKLLQELLGHSKMTTSLTYLRSIRMVNITNTEMPRLPPEVFQNKT